jgi:uncharacterized metal-binding protein
MDECLLVVVWRFLDRSCVIVVVCAAQTHTQEEEKKLSEQALFSFLFAKAYSLCCRVGKRKKDEMKIKRKDEWGWMEGKRTPDTTTHFNPPEKKS